MTWERSTTTNGGWTTITTMTTTSGLYTPVDADVDYYLRATVVYDDAFRTGQRLQLVSEFTTKLSRTDNMAPVFPSLPSFTVSEDAAPGTIVGTIPMATDQEGDPIIYGLTGVDSIHFEINPITGELRVSDAPEFDAESSETLTVRVLATDSIGSEQGTDLTITLALVDEPPDTFDDAATTAEDTAVDIDVFGNDDGDPEKAGDDILALGGTAPLHGTVAVKSSSDPLDPATDIT